MDRQVWQYRVAIGHGITISVCHSRSNQRCIHLLQHRYVGKSRKCIRKPLQYGREARSLASNNENIEQLYNPINYIQKSTEVCLINWTWYLHHEHVCLLSITLYIIMHVTNCYLYIKISSHPTAEWTPTLLQHLADTGGSGRSMLRTDTPGPSAHCVTAALYKWCDLPRISAIADNPPVRLLTYSTVYYTTPAHLQVAEINLCNTLLIRSCIEIVHQLHLSRLANWLCSSLNTTNVAQTRLAKVVSTLIRKASNICGQWSFLILHTCPSSLLSWYQ